MSILDICIILFLLIFLVVGFKRGVIRELFELVGAVLIFIISFYLKNPIGNIFCRFLPFFGFLGGHNALNIILYQAIAFILVFALLLSLYVVIIKVSKVIQKIINMTIVLWLPSKVLGAIVSFIKGWIILFIILLFLLIPSESNKLVNDSLLGKFILYYSPVLSDVSSDFIESVREMYSLSKDNISEKEAVDIMIKYNIVDVDTVNYLIENNKISYK